ncbi:YecA family protein [Neobacillus terrae]|uniref:YecA family protein n=1 Tax=Neobacillus terrae TaxID=3034837 RepID=UPI001409E8B7|nr:SEC-C metal-binding domain-containing protein [Neobacillus terrae]NHM29019.1 metal-binding protein [Neobacillus terrae]
MNVRQFLKCNVCESIIFVRTQLGWLEEYPIRVHCGNCGILISGKAYQDPFNGRFKITFDNSTNVPETNPDYYIEASGELLTEKLQHANFDNKYLYSLPPFFNALFSMGDENYDTFKQNTIGFLSKIKSDWPRVRRIFELFLTGKKEYLKKEVNKHLPVKQFPMNNELEYVRGVHHQYLFFLRPIINENFFKSITKFIWNEINEISKVEGKKLFELAKEFGDNGLLQRYNEKIFSLLTQFVDNFQYMLPVFGIQYLQKNEYKNTKGITTASFEDLKQFYVDCFEVAGELIVLLISYNNLKYRKDFKLMKKKRKDVQLLENYLKLSKGARVEFLDGEENFDKLIIPTIDSSIRNAIGHNTYKYDGAKQELTYYPKGKETTSDAKTISLVDFIEKCWNLFQSINAMAELVYQTQKIYFVGKGNKPINPNIFEVKLKKKKIGRNDPCYCSSGKKYKKCCGNNQ